MCVHASLFLKEEMKLCISSLNLKCLVFFALIRLESSSVCLIKRNENGFKMLECQLFEKRNKIVCILFQSIVSCNQQARLEKIGTLLYALVPFPNMLYAGNSEHIVVIISNL